MKSLQSAIHALSFDPLLSRVCASAPWPQVAALGGWLARADPYREGAAIRRALAIASTGQPDPASWYEHQLWCAWRQSAWTAGQASPLPVRMQGLEWLAETRGRATLLVTPMTLSSADGLDMIRQLNGLDRPCIVFGEAFTGGPDAPEGLEVVGDMSPLTVKRILAVLGEGGVLCTYPDFVYAERAVASMPLFGMRRPVSAGFLALAARDGTMLAPLVCLKEGDGVVVHVEEPVEVQVGALGADARLAVRAAVADTIGALLEDLIRLAPEQWLLLPTLTFDSPEIGRVRLPAEASS